MELSAEQKLFFIEAAQRGEVFTIEGFNNIAQEFTTQGRVNFNDKKVPGVYEDSIFFEFGAAKAKDGFRGEAYVPFYTDIDIFSGSSLIIKTIKDSNRNVIFKNKDANQYFKNAKANVTIEQKRLEMIGRIIPESEMEFVTISLYKLIGHPIIIDNEEPYVLLSVRGANNGTIMLSKGIADLVGSGYVRRHSTLKTIDLNGERIQITRSNKDPLNSYLESMKTGKQLGDE